ncbi:MAG: glutamate formimidoyltransferase [Thermaerobacter sp.]|nr:glutamate formimidoyltransferase [Thermaerobacter sp.]
MLVQCVPNFSEGRDPERLSRLQAAAQATANVRILGFEGDADHHRSVMTLAGDGEAVLDAVFRTAAVAVAMIDLREHRGVHPRMGAVDVIPFVPLANTPMEYAVDLARRLGERIGRELAVPVYLYEFAATRPERRNLADVRRGGYAALQARMARDAPDFGPGTPHFTAGAVAVGARRPLIAFNVYLNTQDPTIADRVARAVRGSSGGLVGVKALGMDTVTQGQVQVSMNLVDYPKTSLPAAVEMVRREAARFGASVTRTELVGFLPVSAAVDSLRYYLQLSDFDSSRILEMALAYEPSGPRE